MKYIKRSSSVIKLSLLAVVILFTVFAAIKIIDNLSSPAIGNISSVKNPVPHPDTNKIATLHGTVVTFGYQSAFQPTKADKLAVGEIEKYVLVNSDVPPWNLTVDIRKLPNGTLNDDGSYNYRKIHTEKYDAFSKVINSQTVVIMSDKSGGYSKVAFFRKGNMGAEVALSTSDSVDNVAMDKSLNTVLSSWQWN